MRRRHRRAGVARRQEPRAPVVERPARHARHHSRIRAGEARRGSECRRAVPATCRALPVGRRGSQPQCRHTPSRRSASGYRTARAGQPARCCRLVAASPTHAVGLQIATALEQIWALDDPNEGILWFERLFERTEAELVAPSLRPRRSEHTAALLISPGTLPQRMRYGPEPRSLRALEDEHGQAVLLHRLGISAMWRGDLAGPVSWSSRAIGSTRHDDVWGRAQTTGTLGTIRTMRVTSEAHSSSSVRAQRWRERRECPGGRAASSRSWHASL